MLPPVVQASALAEAYAAVDWAAGPLDAPETWDASLLSALDLVMSTRFPACLFWGPQLVQLYNEAYVELILDKHPSALGTPGEETFPEAWDTIGPMFRRVLGGGPATWIENSRVPLVRSGFLEDCWFTFSYSPVHDPSGAVAGVLDIAAETTAQVLATRRLELIARLNWALSDVTSRDRFLDRALPLLRLATGDLAEVDLLVGETARIPDAADGDHRLRVSRTAAGPVAWLPLGAAATADEHAVLRVRPAAGLPLDEAHRTFLLLLAAALTQSLERVRLHTVEQAVALAERTLSESLQRSLLTTPMQPDHLQIAVRYLPAASRAQVGGDWYDAFLAGDGALTVVVGDIAGHDSAAAAVMGQVRNLLRGIAATLRKPPAATLTALDAAMHQLGVDAYATGVLAQVEQLPADAATGRRTLRWSNAGHPPPILLRPDGTARLLDTEADLLLGLLPDTDRQDHTVTLEPGSSVLLYTDGLVERRGTPLQESLDALVAQLAGHADLDAESLCDHLLGELAAGADDDIVLLAVHAHPLDSTALAGAQVVSQDVRTSGTRATSRG